MAKPTSKRESIAFSERKWYNIYIYCNTVATRNMKRFYKNQINRAKRRESCDDYLYETKEEWKIKRDCVTQDNFDYDSDGYIDKLMEDERAWLFYESGVQDMREIKSLIYVYKF